MNTETLQSVEAETQVRPIRVLHVLDHSWPVHTGYSLRSLHMIAAQHRLGLRPQVVTGPLQLTDDPKATDTVVDGVSYWRTPCTDSFSNWAITGRRPILRESSVVRLLRRRILEFVDREQVDVIHAHSPALCGLAALRAARARNIPFVYEVRAFWEDAAVDQNKTNTRSLRYVLSQRLEDHVVHRADAIVGIGQSILDELTAR